MSAKSKARMVGGIVKESVLHPSKVSVFDSKSGRLVERSEKPSPRDTEELVNAFVSRPRLMILKAIAGTPLTISEIVAKTKLSRQLVCFHLDILMNVELVSRGYQVMSPPVGATPGRAAQKYSLNVEKYKQGLEEYTNLVITTFPEAVKGVR
ncbi:MAG: ArsR family transcriptional regulator [Nitrososphaerota archaeon]|jgi:DNA-binding transcriptional ArsR family regulator|nr:ArsR family transcriptional regulator [Nitrososphaerota archaeon]MDG6948863.1 ArsR family transcriptional regulator [Nitrososphaerota archaeon]